MKRFYSRGLRALACLVVSAAASFTYAAEAPQKYFGFFGSGNVRYGFERFDDDCLSPTSDPNDRQIVKVAPYTNMVMELGWGNWSSPPSRQAIADCMVKRFIEAKAYGITMAVATVDFLLFDNPVAPMHYRGDDAAVPDLVNFFKQLKDNGVLDMVANGYCYIVDEPASQGLGPDDLYPAIAGVQKAAAQLPELGKCKTFIIYNYGEYPAIDAVDLAGQDNYNMGSLMAGDGVLNDFKSMLRPPTDPHPQDIALVAGGSFGQDPEPFYRALKKDPQIKALVVFNFFDGWKALGVYGNGLAYAYCMVGKKIIDPGNDSPDCTSAALTPMLYVNQEKRVNASAGNPLCYQWSTGVPAKTGQDGRLFTSYWWSTNPSCSYGLNGGKWAAETPEGGACWNADSSQVGCTYTLIFSACGPGATCSADSISVTVK